MVNIARQSGTPRNMQNNVGAQIARAILLCLLSCLLSILDRVVEYVNQYAYAQVAIYGKTYCQSAHDTWSLFKVRGFDALLNDSLIGTGLGFGCLIGGILSGLGAAVVAYSWGTVGPVIFWFIFGFIFGFAMVTLATEVVESAVVCLFVCLCEDPAILQQTKPDIYNDLVPSIQQRYPAINLSPL